MKAPSHTFLAKTLKAMFLRITISQPICTIIYFCPMYNFNLICEIAWNESKLTLLVTLYRLNFQIKLFGT